MSVPEFLGLPGDKHRADQLQLNDNSILHTTGSIFISLKTKERGRTNNHFSQVDC